MITSKFFRIILPLSVLTLNNFFTIVLSDSDFLMEDFSNFISLPTDESESRTFMKENQSGNEYAQINGNADKDQFDEYLSNESVYSENEVSNNPFIEFEIDEPRTATFLGNIDSDYEEFGNYDRDDDWSELNSVSSQVSSSSTPVSSLFDQNSGLYYPPQLSAHDFKSDGNTIDITNAQTHPHDNRQISAIVGDLENRLIEHGKEMNRVSSNGNESKNSEKSDPSSKSSPKSTNIKFNNSITDLDYAAIIIGALGGLFISLTLFGICVALTKIRANKQKQEILKNSNELSDKQLNGLLNV